MTLGHTHTFGNRLLGPAEQGQGGHFHRVYDEYGEIPTDMGGMKTSTFPGSDFDGHTHSVKGKFTGPAVPPRYLDEEPINEA